MEDQFVLIAQKLKDIENLPPTSPTERITRYAKNIAIIHQQRPYLTRFIISELINPTSCYEAVIKKYISRLFDFLRTTLEEGISKGELKASLNPELATISLAGIMNFFFISKPIFQEFTVLSKNVEEEYTSQALETFLNGIVRRNEDE